MPSAYGRPQKPAVHGVAKKPAAHGVKAATTTTTRAAAHSRASTSHEAGTSHESIKAHESRTRHGAEAGGAEAHAVLRTRAEKRGAGRHAEKAQAEVKPVAATRVRAKAAAAMVRSEPKAVVAARPVVIAAKPVQAAETPAGSAAGSGQTDEPAVKHDRKHHLTDEPAPNGGKAADTNGGNAEASAALFTKGGRLIMPPAMKGSHEILVRQNVMADQDGLERIQDDDDLDRMRRAGTLLALPENAGLQADDRLPANRRFARPWTVKFLEGVAKAHYERFHTALQVNSAARTVEFQRNLMRVNGNAAPAEGETASPHLTGQAVDLAKKGLSMTEIAWMRGYLLPLVQQGKIDVEEEFQQSCFHISVYRKYVPDPAPRREIVSRPLSGSAIAAAVMR